METILAMDWRTVGFSFAVRAAQDEGKIIKIADNEYEEDLVSVATVGT